MRSCGINGRLSCAVVCLVLLALAVTGATLQNNIPIFVMIAGICVVIGLVAFDKVKEAYYPYLIWSIGLALLLQTTLMGPGLVGSDIHTEYYFYNNALNGWDATIRHPYNAAFGSTVIAPLLTHVTNLLHVPGYWIYKLVFPVLFSFVSALLYFIFKKEFGPKVAFMSAIFFLTVPTWSMELIALPRQMLGELMLALCLFLVMVSKWKMRIRIPLLMVLGVLGAMFHYVMGPLIIFYLGLSGFFLLFFKRRVFPVKWIIIVVGVLAIGNVVYYSLVAQGVSLECITGVSTSYLSRFLPFIDSTHSKYIAEVQPWVDSATDAGSKYIASMSPLLKTAWGVDFGDANVWGKVFRVFQYLTQLAIVLGVICLVRNHKKYSAEYLSFCISSVLLLGLCVFIPKFADIINPTRFYHIVLFLLAPVFILGGTVIFRNLKILTVLLIIPYFLFTSGAVFELTQQTDMSRVNMPYSIVLSNHRMDIVGVFTENDITVQNWAADNLPGLWIYADTHSYLLLSEGHIMTPYWSIAEALNTGIWKGSRYVFLSERNNEWGIITLRPGEWGDLYCKTPTSGMRVSYSYADVGLDKLIAEGRIVYRQGDAFILEVTDGTN